MEEESRSDGPVTQTGWQYSAGRLLVVVGAWMMKERPQKRSGLSLRYLLLETGLWGVALASWVWLHPHIQTRSETVLAILMTYLYLIFGAAIGGLCRRPGVGAFVGVGLAATLLLLQAVDH